jgi:hypothetical protein
LGTFCLKQTNPSLYLPIAFTNIFIKPSLICSRCIQIFYLSAKAGCATFFWPGDVSEWSGHFLFYGGSPSLGCPIHTENSRLACIRLAALSASLTLGRYIHSTGVFHSVFFVVRTAWISGTEGNSLPLWSNTAFTLTLDESMKSLLCSGVYSSCSCSIND